MDVSFVISLAVSAAALAAAGFIIFRAVRAGRSRPRASDPFIVFPVHEGIDRTESAMNATTAPPPAPPAAPSPSPRPSESPEPEFSPPAGHEPYMPPPAGANVPDGDLVEGKTIRFYRAPEGTLQFLPGRLEIIDGADEGQEIRFVRPRDGVPEITFGRSNGPPLQHIQLRAPTVSRQHARMRLEQGRWQIRNLSRTNPVVLNGEELRTGNGSRTLAEGDRIEMGEVVFRFREQ